MNWKNKLYICTLLFFSIFLFLYLVVRKSTENQHKDIEFIFSNRNGSISNLDFDNLVFGGETFFSCWIELTFVELNFLLKNEIIKEEKLSFPEFDLGEYGSEINQFINTRQIVGFSKQISWDSRTDKKNKTMIEKLVENEIRCFRMLSTVDDNGYKNKRWNIAIIGKIGSDRYFVSGYYRKSLLRKSM